MKLKFRTFSGLMTNIDQADKSTEYFARFKNIKVYPGFIKSEGLRFEEIESDKNELELVRQQYVFIDDDIYQNKYENNQLINTYLQNIKKYLFKVFYSNDCYYFFLDDRKVYGEYKAEAGEYPLIINEKGTIKVFFKDETIWIGKLNRYLWNDQIPYKIEDQFYAEPLRKTYSKVLNPFEFIQQNKTTSQNIINAVGTVYNDSNLEWQYEGENYSVVKIGFDAVISGVNTNIKIPDWNGSTGNANGYLVVLKTLKYSYPTYAEFTADRLYAINRNFYLPIFPDLAYLTSKKLEEFPHWKGYLLTNGEYADSLGHEQFYFFNETELRNFFSNVKINRTAIYFSEDLYFASNELVEMVVTTIVDSQEFVEYYEQLPASRSSYIIKVNLNTPLLKGLRRKEGFRVYIRHRQTTEEKENKDFEQCFTYYLLDKNPKQFDNIYINKLTPNGIFLTQVIGKFFDPETYEIITGFDDYVNVAGIPYGLKNGNVYYPAVGNGMILNNFYKENFIPNIEGKMLIALGNLLGVFSGIKNMMTLIDFTPVDSQMIFYIKDTFEYKIRDKQDIVETTEGTFIHLRDGIYVTNGRERTLISYPINDIVKDNYDTGSIFYSSYYRQLYYWNNLGFYAYDFETQSWVEYDYPIDTENNMLILRK